MELRKRERLQKLRERMRLQQRELVEGEPLTGLERSQKVPPREHGPQRVAMDAARRSVAMRRWLHKLKL